MEAGGGVSFRSPAIYINIGFKMISGIDWQIFEPLHLFAGKIETDL
jgi:hypothetical protein